VNDRPWVLAPNFGDIINETCRLDPARIVLIAGACRLSYGELDVRAGRFAQVLRASGVQPGETVALAVGNDWRFVETLLGTLRAGAVALLVNTKLGAETLEYITDHSEVRFIVAGEALGEKLSVMADAAENLAGTLTVDQSTIGSDYEAAIAAVPAAAQTLPGAPDDPAILMYTSGSTGRPKGCVLSHSNTWWQARSSSRTMMHDRSDRGLITGPLYHANALWGVLFPMMFTGGSMVILPEFDTSRALEAIHQHRVTFTSGTPSMYALLLADPLLRSVDVSSITLLTCGSAPVPAELMATLIATFECEVAETYGMTESGANILTPRWGVKKLGSTGLPVPDAEIRIADSADPSKDTPEGEVGELWSRSPANALGYLKDPHTTAERFTADGWLRTGDLMRRDEQGYCYFCGRTDDMISVGGENVYPKEVESIILTQPAVADVCVVPVAHHVKGEAPVAFVVLKPGMEASEQEIRSHCLTHGPAYAHPRRVFFLDRLPLSSTNKLDRGLLTQQAAELLPDGLASSER
jgi:long-chain acyl-CoA synthetase